MMGLLFLAFAVIPILELSLFMTGIQLIGIGGTLYLVLFTAIVGAYLARQQGHAALLRLQNSMEKGVPPGEELLGGVFILLGGVVLLTPGFFTDFLGLACLFPPTRHLAIRILQGWLAKRIENGNLGFDLRAGGFRMASPGPRPTGHPRPKPVEDSEEQDEITGARVIDIQSRRSDREGDG